MIDIKNNVTNGAQVHFSHYFDGDLWYVTDSGHSFPVPISEAGTATFNAQEKAILFMRYMKAHNKTLDEGSKVV